VSVWGRQGSPDGRAGGCGGSCAGPPPAWAGNSLRQCPTDTDSIEYFLLEETYSNSRLNMSFASSLFCSFFLRNRKSSKVVSFWIFLRETSF
jgi:hypothetical protein